MKSNKVSIITPQPTRIECPLSQFGQSLDYLLFCQKTFIGNQKFSMDEEGYAILEKTYRYKRIPKFKIGYSKTMPLPWNIPGEKSPFQQEDVILYKNQPVFLDKEKFINIMGNDNLGEDYVYFWGPHKETEVYFIRNSSRETFIFNGQMSVRDMGIFGYTTLEPSKNNRICRIHQPLKFSKNQILPFIRRTVERLQKQSPA